MSDREERELTVEELIAMGFTTTLREYDAECDLRDQYRASRATLPGEETR